MLTNAVGATISPLRGSELHGGERRITGKLDNKGTITIPGDTYLTLYSGSTGNTNSGTIDLLPGVNVEVPTLEKNASFTLLQVESPTTFTNTTAGKISIGANRTVHVQTTNDLANAGVIGGIGIIRLDSLGTLTNTGTLAPGGVGVIGTLTIDGEWFAGTGTVSIEVADSVGNGYDILHVTGVAHLGGTLSAQALSPFIPIPFTFYVVVVTSDANWCTDDFAMVSDEWSYYNDGCVHLSYQGPPASPPSGRAAKRPPSPAFLHQR
jgi:hypothetical protein